MEVHTFFSEQGLCATVPDCRVKVLPTVRKWQDIMKRICVHNEFLAALALEGFTM